MRIVENTSDRLVLQVLPLRVGMLLGVVTLLPMLWGWALWNAGEAKGGAILFGIGVILLVGCFGAFVTVLRVTLDRRRDVAEVVETGIFGSRRVEHVLHELTGATLQSMVIKRKPGEMRDRPIGAPPPKEPRVWRVALVHRNGNKLPLTEIYGGEATYTRAAGVINGWFGRPTEG